MKENQLQKKSEKTKQDGRLTWLHCKNKAYVVYINLAGPLCVVYKGMVVPERNEGEKKKVVYGNKPKNKKERVIPFVGEQS